MKRMHKSVSFFLGGNINTFITTTSQRGATDEAQALARRLKVGLAVVGLTLTRALHALWTSRPLLVTALAMYVAILFLYANEERSQQLFHASHRTENRFWMASTFWLATSIIFAPDSPLYVYLYSNDFWTGGLTGITSVVALIYCVHVGHKLSHWSTLEKKARIPKNKSYRDAIGLLDEAETDNMEDLVLRVQASVAKLESAVIPGGMKRYWERNNLLKLERNVIDIFAHASRAELNYLTLHLNLNVVLYRLKNHGTNGASSSSTNTITLNRVITPPAPPLPPTTTLNHDYQFHMDHSNHRYALITILTFQRVSELTISARVAVLDAIQVVGLMRNPDTAQLAVAGVTNIILNTTSRQLTKLKTFMDSKGSFHSMHKLVYDDIEDESVRAQLVSHFQVQGNVTVIHAGRGRKVISDVDDTLMCSGGRYPAGIDNTYPRHFVYPGAFSFYESLDMHFLRRQDGDSSSSALDTDEDATKSNDDTGIMEESTRKVGNLVFLSARPHVYKDISEKRVYAKFEKMMRGGQTLHSMPTLLPGDLESGQAYMLRGDFEPMAQKKLKNMIEYRSLFPEFTHVFVGDNGQADVRAAELMIERFGDDLEAVFIHLVQPLSRTFGFDERTSYRKWITEGHMVFYHTFVGAATQAFKRGLIEIENLERVMVTSCAEFKTLPLTKTPGGILGQERRRIELVKDFGAANALLEDNGLDAIDPPESSCHYPVGSTVYGRIWGEGFVRAFRPADGIYEVVLKADKLVGYFSVFDLSSSPFLNTGMFVGMEDGGINILSSNNNKDVPRQAFPVFQPGTKVVVAGLGPGVVRRHRRADDMVEVNFNGWNAIGFVRARDVQKEGSKIWKIWGNLRRGAAAAASGTFEVVRSPADASPSLSSVSSRTSSVTARFEVGCRVTCKYGEGVIAMESREAEDGIMVVHFTAWKATGYIHWKDLMECDPPPMVASANVGGTSSSAFGVVFSKLPNLRGGSRTSPSAGGKPVFMDTLRKLAPAFSLQGFGGNNNNNGGNMSPIVTTTMEEAVSTPYGAGIMVSREGSMCKVKLEWGADLYCPVNSIVVLVTTPTPTPLSSLQTPVAMMAATTKAKVLGGIFFSTAETQTSKILSLLTRGGHSSNVMAVDATLMVPVPSPPTPSSITDDENPDVLPR